jgi:hypothetical protein
MAGDEDEVALGDASDQRGLDQLRNLAAGYDREDLLERPAARAQDRAMLDVAFGKKLVRQLHVTCVDYAPPKVEHQTLVGGERRIGVPERRERIGVGHDVDSLHLGDSCRRYHVRAGAHGR